MAKNRGFTLIETLIVMTIFGLLTGFGAITYSQQSKSARDATRKSNIEEIAQALEQFKSNNTYSSYPEILDQLVPTYMSKKLQDPKTKTDYSYTPYPDSPQCTDDDALNPCISYTLGTNLETNNQSFYLGPYGETTPIPTSTPTSTPTPTPTTVINSCSSYCLSLGGYTGGTCRATQTACGNNKQVWAGKAGDVYCTGGSNVDTCCCTPQTTPTPTATKTPTPTPTNMPTPTPTKTPTPTPTIGIKR